MADYPLPKFHFQVQWADVQIGFTEVSGLDFETEKIEYRHGASPEYVKTCFPGQQKYTNITMKRGVFAGDNDLFTQWRETVKFQNIERQDVIISLLDEEHQPVVTWTVKRAWPIKVQSTDMKSDGNEVAIETVELAHEGLTVEHVG